MKTIQPPVRTTKKAHWLIGRDRRIAAIALVPEARTAPPELNRVRSWKQAASEPMSNEFTSDIWNHDDSITYLQLRLNRHLVPQ